jgi:hypothetical protein
VRDFLRAPSQPTLHRSDLSQLLDLDENFSRALVETGAFRKSNPERGDGTANPAGVSIATETYVLPAPENSRGHSQGQEKLSVHPSEIPPQQKGALSAFPPVLRQRFCVERNDGSTNAFAA